MRPALAAALFLLTLAVFWPATGNDFVNYDDDVYVTANRQVLDGPTADGLAWAATTFHGANWHPLTWFSHQIDAALWGTRPFGHHLTSVLLHAANAALVFWLFALSCGVTWRPAVAAALWSIHPLRVESVAWVAERKDVLSGLFALLALLAWVAWTRRPGPLRYTLLLLLFAAGLAAKPMLVTLPCVMLLLDVWPLRRVEKYGVPRLVLEKLPLFALSVAASVVTYVAQRAGGSIETLERFPLAARIANALAACGAYLLDTLVPRGLAVFYPHPANGPGVPALAASALALAGLATLAWLLRRRLSALGVGGLWFLGMLVPVIGLVQTGLQARADRYTYLPAVGLFLAAVWGAAALLAAARQRGARLPTAALALACVALLAASIATTRAQLRHWKNSETLFAHALRVTADNWTAHLNLALALADDGRHAEALRQLERAVALRPESTKARHNLGVELRALGRLAESETRLRETLHLDPAYAAAWNNLGVTLAALGRTVEARAALERAAALDAQLADAAYNLGTLDARAGDIESAIAAFDRALALEPRHAAARYNLAAALHLAGRHDEARRALRLALREGFDVPPEMARRIESGGN